ncbi:MAG: alkylhydroperoxidase/carboxymuconolactone decarboxylase family protein YurZ [Planctomycetota bacterium]
MSLTTRDAQLVRITIAIVIGDWDEVTRLRHATPEEHIDRSWREAVLQTHLFAGFPRLVAALEVLDQAGGLGSIDPEELETIADRPVSEVAKDAEQPDKGRDSEQVGAASAASVELEPAAPAADRRGSELFDRIYAKGAAGVRSRLHELHPDFALWVAEHAYARVLARPGLAADRRELLAAAALIATRQDRQLASHARGAIRCGASPDELFALLPLVQPYIDEDWFGRAKEILQRFGKYEQDHDDA